MALESAEPGAWTNSLRFALQTRLAEVPASMGNRSGAWKRHWIRGSPEFRLQWEVGFDPGFPGVRTWDADGMADGTLHGIYMDLWAGAIFSSLASVLAAESGGSRGARSNFGCGPMAIFP